MNIVGLGEKATPQEAARGDALRDMQKKVVELQLQLAKERETWQSQLLSTAEKAQELSSRLSGSEDEVKKLTEQLKKLEEALETKTEECRKLTLLYETLEKELCQTRTITRKMSLEKADILRCLATARERVQELEDQLKLEKAQFRRLRQLEEYVRRKAELEAVKEKTTRREGSLLLGNMVLGGYFGGPLGLGAGFLLGCVQLKSDPEQARQLEELTQKIAQFSPEELQRVHLECRAK